MSFHHIAIATRDMQATHEFYTEGMGFELVHAEKAKMGENAWAKHFFYDTGNGELMAFWEIHDDTLPADFPTSISAGLGLPPWSNHLAFGARDEADLEENRKRLMAAGHNVTEIDHHWCKSIYAMDPNGILVEFCTTVRAFATDDRSRALAALHSDDMADEPPPIVYRYEVDSNGSVAL